MSVPSGVDPGVEPEVEPELESGLDSDLDAGLDSAPTHFELRLSIRRETLTRLLVGGIVFTALAGFCAEIATHLEMDDPYYLIQFFGLSYEENLPTWYTSMLLFACAVTLSFISVANRRTGGRHGAHWWVLTGVFYLISLDEIAQYHEEISNFFDYEGVLYFGWVIPAGIFVTIFGASYLRFLGQLPRRIALRIMLAGGIYVFGALVMELPLGYWTDTQGKENLGYGMIDLVEESLEIIGVSLFLYTLLEHMSVLSTPAPELEPELEPEPEESPNAEELPAS